MFAMEVDEPILAARLGLTVHVSPMRFRLTDLYLADAATTAPQLEDWLIDVANARGAKVVFREEGTGPSWQAPNKEVLSNEELVVALCQLQCLDRPQMFRPAAQLISRGVVDLSRLLQTAERERVTPILAELARQALRVEPDHTLWKRIARHCQNEKPLRDTLLHWTRLAEPVMKGGHYNAERWRLVA